MTLEEATRPRERLPPTATATSAVDAMDALRLWTDGEAFPTSVASERRQDEMWRTEGISAAAQGIALWAQTDPFFGPHFSLKAHS